MAFYICPQNVFLNQVWISHDIFHIFMQNTFHVEIKELEYVNNDIKCVMSLHVYHHVWERVLLHQIPIPH